MLASLPGSLRLQGFSTFGGGLRVAKGVVGSLALLVTMACGPSAPESSTAKPTLAPDQAQAKPKAQAKPAPPSPANPIAAPAPVQRWQAAPSFDQRGKLSCPQKNRPGVGILLSADRPSVVHELSLLVAVLGNEETPQVQVLDKAGKALAISGRARKGIPAIADLKLGRLRAGKYQVRVKQGEEIVGCSHFWVRHHRRTKSFKKLDSIPRERMWQARRSWSPAEEALYSAWIVLLFDGDTKEDLAWSSMHEVTRDPKRNWLWNRKNWGEDNADGLKLRPDCADTPYFLRAYYAWKRQLPFMFHRCNRGTDKKAPRCRSNQSSKEPPIFRKRWLSDKGSFSAYNKSIKQALRDGNPYPKFDGGLTVSDPRQVLEYFFSRTVGWGVHTGNGRVAWDDMKNDFYPVALRRENLRPGTIYADPYGHILMLVDLHPGAQGSPSVLFAVDGQPDASITRKRFWQGNFLWNADPALGGSGFKAFRPVLLNKKDGSFRMLKDSEIAAVPGYAKKAGDLTRFSKVSFYDHMERLITPGVVQPQLALRQLVDALAEAVRIRIRSVQNGVDWVRDNPGKTIEMPNGFKLFETTGAWENFSTPARDLRLLIAIDAVMGFPAKVGRNPKAYGVDPGAVKAAVQKLKAQLGAMLDEPNYRIEYRNSAGQDVTLSLSQVVERAKAFEMAYNPNDCPEIRWGAKPKSTEAKSCKRRAPQTQQTQMQRYRPWFSQRRRPARGEEAPR